MKSLELAQLLSSSIKLETKRLLKDMEKSATRRNFSAEQLEDIALIAQFVALKAVLSYHDLMEQKDD